MKLFHQNVLIPNFIKFHTVGDELFHADRQTDMMQLVVVNMPKNDK